MVNVTQPILYSFRRCPYAMRARIIVYTSGVSVELREVVLRDKPAAMLEVSPKGTVPVLVLPDGTVMDESLDIMRWALAAADPLEWLSGNADEMFGLVAQCDGDFKHHLDRYKYATRYDGAVSEEHRAEAEFFLKVLEHRLSNNSYLFGSQPTLADYAVVPFIRQFANTDKNWFDATPYEALRKWKTELLHRSPFVEVMQKYPQWQPGDTPLIFSGS